MTEATLQQIVDSLATTLGRSVAIDDAGMRLKAVSRHFGDADRLRLDSLLHRDIPPENRRFVMAHGVAGWDGPGRVEASPGLGAVARVCVPVRLQGLLLGYLWLIDPDGQIHEPQLACARRAADDAALVLYRERLHQRQERAAEEQVLRQLLTRGGRSPDAVLAELAPNRLPSRPAGVTVLIFDVTAPAQPSDDSDALVRSAADDAVQSLSLRSTLHLVDGHRLVLLLCAAKAWDGPFLKSAARQIRSRIQQLMGPAAAIRVGIGSPTSTLDQAWQSFDHAQDAVRAGQALTHLGDIVAWDELDGYAVLARLSSAGLTSADCPAAVTRLAEADPSGRLLATVEVFLDEAGHPQRTASILNIHRTTLHYRLRRAEEIAGIDFGDGHDRLTMHLGIKLARFTGGVTGIPQ